MAPRSAKGKKAADVKLADNEAPKKGRGKAKIVEDPEPDIDTEDNEMVIVEKKAKRGKKAANDANGQEQNGKKEETAPAAKKGRKKNIEPVVEEKSNDDQSAEEESVATEDTEQNDEDSDANGVTEEPQAPSGRGRKKQAKKETEKTETKTSRGRKAKQDVDYEEKDVDEKPKTGRGRGRKPAVKVDEAESDKSEEETKPDPPAAKGRKKAPVRAAKEKTPDSEKDADEDFEEKPVEETKKKETKGRKNQGKKAQAKEEVDDDDEIKEEPASKKRRINKKEDKAKEPKDDDDMEDDVPEYKPTKGRRGQKKVAEVQAENDDEPQDTGEPTKRRRKANEEKAPEDSDKKAPLKNKSATDYEKIVFSNDAKSVQGRDWNFKISSWNVDGIRAWLGKGGLDYIKYEKPDILCLQEVKCAKDKLPKEVANLPGYHAYWLCSEKDGYAGVGIYTTQLAMNVQYGLQNEELDSEGRIITAEYEQFYLICTYVPNAGRKLVSLPKRLQWNEEFRKHVKELDKKKPVIICGDMNVSHNEIDLANPKTNRKNAGFTDEERSGMTDLLNDGFVDTYRHLNASTSGAYTFWTYMKNSRSKNVGWRLDYFVVSDRLMPSLCDNVIRDQVYGSDHCPITLFLHLSSADKPKE